MKILIALIIWILGVPLLATVTWKGLGFKNRWHGRAVKRSYYQGYSWAMSALHTGADLAGFYPPFKQHPTTSILGAFDHGVADAIRAFDAIDGDKMWDKAKQRVAQ